MSSPFAAVIERIETADRVLVISHDRPDGDAIGSTLAMGRFVEGLGKEVVMANADPVPERLAFLPGSERLRGPGEPVGADLVVAVDSAGRDRIDEAVWAMAAGADTVVNIDHHPGNSRFGDLDHVDADSPATGQILFELARAAGWTPDREIAVNLYAAISTDTGSFRYPSTKAETLRIAGDLVDCGVDVGEINRMLYENYPRRRVDLLRILLEDMRIACHERYASVRLPLALSRELGIRAGDTEGIIDVVRAIDTVVVAAFFEELPEGRIRVSARSDRPEYDVGKVCAELGGGGHAPAAGARLDGPLEAAEAVFLEHVAALLGKE